MLKLLTCLLMLKAVLILIFGLLLPASTVSANVNSDVIIVEPRIIEIMLPMRDGVRLHTIVVFPRNFVQGQVATTIVDRSPYGYTHLELLNDMFLPVGFITIGQDMRGTEMSEGNFSIWHSDANDSQDLGDWIVQQSWSDGSVFSFGVSADGLAAFTMVTNSPVWMGAQYFIWASSTGYDVIYPNGAYLTSLADTWIRSTVMNEADKDLQILRENEMRNDWWLPLDLKGNFSSVHGRGGFWAGWYDVFLVGNLLAYEGYNYQSDPSVRYSSRLTVDPLGHCQDAAVFYPQNLIDGRTALALVQAFETFGVVDVRRSDIKNVTFYVMSSNDQAGLDVGQYWTSLEHFPTPTLTNYYLHSDGSANNNKPVNDEGESSQYVHDPTEPIPTAGGNNLQLPCGPLDQSDVDGRDDVLVFQTVPITNALYLTGPIFATLYVGSNATDTDFMVRVSDVYPTGEARLLQDSAIRMRWREGGLTPLSMAPGEVYEARLSLWNTSYVVAPGHALRFAISSSNYPRFDVNQNNGILLANQSPSDVNFSALNTLFHSAQYPSHVTLPVVSRKDLPEVRDIQGEARRAYPEVDFEAISHKYPDIIASILKPFQKYA